MTAPSDARVVVVQGTEVPRLGFGTFQMSGAACREGVRDALGIGYRHIDTARAYENEDEVGAGIRDSGVPREQIFLTTKVPMERATRDEVRRSADESLRALGTEYVDLLLLHWPAADVAMGETLGAMALLQDAGKARHLGVSNFPPGLLRQALEHIPVFADQVEFHPFLGQDRLLELAGRHDFTVTAYAPLAHGKVPRDPVLREIAAAHGRTPAQVALRWLLDIPGTTVIPKASSHERRVENFEVFDFDLSDEDRARIDALPKDQRDFDGPWAPDWERWAA
jgi:2,5-diketo-D-gluconate reductase B